MGRVVNPGNEGFANMLATWYVDKTGLISEFDSTVETNRGLILMARPRRFGKSYAALSLAAFYSCGCESKQLFDGLEVSKRPGWDAHLNAYNVVLLDMTGVIEGAKQKARLQRTAGDEMQASHVSWPALVVPTATEWIIEELRAIVPDAGVRAGANDVLLTNAILDVINVTKRKFVFVIDEWDAPYHLAAGDVTSHEAYAGWLRSLFNDITFTSKAVAGANLTGILPTSKHDHRTAVSGLREYTMLDPGAYAPYMGFTENEVLELSSEARLDLQEMRHLYEGYTLRYVDGEEDNRCKPVTVTIYSPYSVVQAVERCEVGPLLDNDRVVRGATQLRRH